MTFAQLAEMLYGVSPDALSEEQHQTVAIRLNEIFADSIHFVAAGANKSKKWLIQKQKKRGDEMTTPIGAQVLRDAAGNWLFVTPTQKSEPAPTLKLSAAIKSGLEQMITGVMKQLTDLGEVVKAATDADDVTEIPESIATQLTAVVKAITGDKAEPKPAAAPAVKEGDGKTDEPKPAPAAAKKEGGDATFALKDGQILTGTLATLAKEMTEAAQERLSADPDFADKFQASLVDMQRMHTEVDPAGFGAALAGVQKSMKADMDALREDNKKLAAAVRQAGLPFAAPPTVPDGEDTTAAPVQKSDDDFEPLYGMDLGDRSVVGEVKGFLDSGK